MNFLFDLLVELAEIIRPKNRADDRSIVGESRMDQRAKMWAGIAASVLFVIGVGGWIWWEWFR